MSKSKPYTPRFTREGNINTEYVASSKKNAANFASEFDKIDHVATTAHKSKFNRGLQLALEAETGRTGLSLSQLKSI
jgi:hypothetical protein